MIHCGEYKKKPAKSKRGPSLNFEDFADQIEMVHGRVGSCSSQYLSQYVQIFSGPLAHDITFKFTAY